MLTVRARLSLLYAAVFIVAGMVLLVITWGLAARRLPLDHVVVVGPGTATNTPHAVDLDADGPSLSPDGLGVSREVLDRAAEVRADTLHSLVVQGATALAIVGVASLGLGWVVAGRFLRPVHRITESARQISHEDLRQRLNLSGPHDELRELGDTFDEMLDRIADGIEAERIFLSNASHELRTPLSIQRTVLEVGLQAEDETSLRRAASRALDTTIRAERMVESLLLLARAGRVERNDDYLDLREIAASCLDRVDLGSAEVRADLQSAPTSGDGVLLERVVANLLENAVRHNVEGGWVEIRTWKSAGTSYVSLSNSGSVLTDQEVSSLVEPFRRGAVDRTGQGVGLGLSIVRAAVRAHGGSLVLAPRSEGGMQVHVSLPTDDQRNGAAGLPASRYSRTDRSPEGRTP